MARLSLGMIASMLLILMAFGFVVAALDSGNVYAGGEEEELQPVEEKETAKSERKLIWFVIGFMAAIIIVAL